jgi:hypothetical protein
MNTLLAIPVITTKGYCLSSTDRSDRVLWDIIDAPQYIILGDGEFMVSGPHNRMRIATLTGRERRMTATWQAVTVNLWEVDTVVKYAENGDPSLWGIKGDIIPGTWAMNKGAMA